MIPSPLYRLAFASCFEHRGRKPSSSRGPCPEVSTRGMYSLGTKKNDIIWERERVCVCVCVCEHLGIKEESECTYFPPPVLTDFRASAVLAPGLMMCYDIKSESESEWEWVRERVCVCVSMKGSKKRVSALTFCLPCSHMPVPPHSLHVALWCDMI